MEQTDMDTTGSCNELPTLSGESPQILPEAIKNTSKKTVLKETPAVKLNTPGEKPKEKQSDLLLEYYSSIVNGETLHLNSKRVFEVLATDLEVDMSSITSRMKYVLSESLCYFMKVWPGWASNEARTVNGGERFVKFKEYLKNKIKNIVENEHLFHKDVEVKKKDMVSTACQTAIPGKGNKPESPFSLVICGQPSVLNNIVFVEVDNNIVIKQHLEKPWKQLTPMQFFINHPYVKISIDFPNVSITRANLHVYKRYITECGDTACHQEVDFISKVVNSSPLTVPIVYSYDLMAAYFNQLNALTLKYNVKNRAILECVIGEYLQDIKDVNLHGGTMAVPFTVAYNIGGKTYIRNKKMVVSNSKNKDANAINFCEILIPKVSFSLDNFNVEEDFTASEVSFVDLNNVDKMSEEDLLNFLTTLDSCLTFYCTLCNKIYMGERAYTDCMDHFRFMHKGEQAVLCFKCHKAFEVTNLAARRWAHDCDIKTEEVETAASETDKVGGQSNMILN